MSWKLEVEVECGVWCGVAIAMRCAMCVAIRDGVMRFLMLR